MQLIRNMKNESQVMPFVVEMDICADYHQLSSRRFSNSHHMSRIYDQRAQGTMETGAIPKLSIFSVDNGTHVKNLKTCSKSVIKPSTSC